MRTDGLRRDFRILLALFCLLSPLITSASASVTLALPASADAYIARTSIPRPETDPGRNYGLSGQLRVGSQLSDEAYTTLVGFDLSGLRNIRSVEKAELLLHVGMKENGGTEVEVRRATSAWNEATVTGRSTVNTTSSDAVRKMYDRVGTGSGRVDVTTIVNHWRLFPTANWGLAIAAAPEAVGLVVFSARETPDPPRLLVTVPSPVTARVDEAKPWVVQLEWLVSLQTSATLEVSTDRGASWTTIRNIPLNQGRAEWNARVALYSDDAASLRPVLFGDGTYIFRVLRLGITGEEVLHSNSVNVNPCSSMPTGSRPAILVPGIGGDHEHLRDLQSALEDDLGTPVWIAAFPPYSGVPEAARLLSHQIAGLSHTSSGWPAAIGEIDIIGYSMGGLVARWLVEIEDSARALERLRARKLITLGTPHNGSDVAERLAGYVGIDDYSLAEYSRTLNTNYPGNEELIERLLAWYQSVRSHHALPGVIDSGRKTRGGVNVIARLAGSDLREGTEYGVIYGLVANGARYQSPGESTGDGIVSRSEALLNEKGAPAIAVAAFHTSLPDPGEPGNRSEAFRALTTWLHREISRIPARGKWYEFREWLEIDRYSRTEGVMANRIRLSVPAGALGVLESLSVSALADGHYRWSEVEAANRSLAILGAKGASEADGGWFGQGVYEFEVEGGMHGEFTSLVEIGIPYPDLDDNGIVDGTGKREESLLIGHLESGRWNLITPIRIDAAENIAYVEVPHFSIYAPVLGAAGGSAPSPSPTTAGGGSGTAPSDRTSAPSSSASGSCIIAATAPASVTDLCRVFRDVILLQSAWGRAIASVYYRLFGGVNT